MTHARPGAADLPAARPGRDRTPIWWPLAAYAALSLALFASPIFGDFSGHAVASDAIDSSAFMWFYAWWPHALAHGLDPLTTHAVFVPEGFNLTWATSMPAASTLLAPVTELFGPVVSWNVVQLACPALAAWTMYLLGTELTGRTAPSLAAGYVFGFSPYMLTHLTGGPNLALVALLPVIVRLIVVQVRAAGSARRFVTLMALTLVGQYLTSAEVLVTATMFGAIAGLAGYGLLPEWRRAIARTGRLVAIAFGVCLVVISPFLIGFFFGRHYPPSATGFPADLASFVLPPSLVALGNHGAQFVGANNEPYLGVPLVALVLIWMVTERRRRMTWVIATPMLLAGILALGSHLLVRGHRTAIPLPWILFAHLPVIRYAIPVRFALFTIFGAAVIVALFTARRGRRTMTSPAVGRWALALVVIASIAPDAGSSAWNTTARDPSFFADGTYRRYLNASDHVLTVPVWGPNERWQADSGFAFQLAAGYLGQGFPRSYTRDPAWTTLLTGRLTRDYAAQIRRFVHDKGVTAIVVDATDAGPWPKLFAPLGVRPVRTGGVSFYRLRG